MGMRRNLIERQSHGLGPGQLSHNKASPLMHRNAAAQIGQGKGVLAIAPIGGADELEERGELRDGHELTITKGVTLRRKIAGHHAEFDRYMGSRHRAQPFSILEFVFVFVTLVRAAVKRPVKNSLVTAMRRILNAHGNDEHLESSEAAMLKSIGVLRQDRGLWTAKHQREFLVAGVSRLRGVQTRRLLLASIGQFQRDTRLGFTLEDKSRVQTFGKSFVSQLFRSGLAAENGGCGQSGWQKQRQRVPELNIWRETAYDYS